MKITISKSRSHNFNTVSLSVDHEFEFTDEQAFASEYKRINRLVDGALDVEYQKLQNLTPEKPVVNNNQSYSKPAQKRPTAQLIAFNDEYNIELDINEVGIKGTHDYARTVKVGRYEYDLCYNRDKDNYFLSTKMSLVSQQKAAGQGRLRYLPLTLA